MNKIKKYICNSYFILLVYAVIFTVISYISINTNSQIFDYPFHMARILGLAQSISHNDFLPNLNFLYGFGVGYSVPMFYGNWLFYIPALVFLKTKIATVAFTSFAFIVVVLTTWISYYSLYQITKSKSKSLAFAMVIPATYPFFGFGMTAVAFMVPYLIYCLYKVFYLDRFNPIPLGITVALLVQTHIISTVVLAITSFIFVLINYKKINKKVIQSFFLSLLIALALSAGFILQYLEQSKSQLFFVSWILRDFPFPTSALMVEDDLFVIIKNYMFPISLVFLLFLLLIFKKLTRFSKQLVVTVIVIFIISSGILPWEDILKYSFLATLQYTSRLTYFLPILIFMAIATSCKRSTVLTLACVQVLFYILWFPLRFTPNSANYAQKYALTTTNINVMREQNTKGINAFTHPSLTTYDTSGDEYFNLSVDHNHVRDGSINKFDFDKNNITISNVKNKYNLLEFNYQIKDRNSNSNIVLPRIWYKGYVAKYSDGASGSAPKIINKRLSKNEIKNYKQLHKPNTNTKALYDGRAVIKVKSSGKVKVFYQKTKTQILGFTIEFIAWTSLLVYVFISFLKIRGRSHEKIINSHSLL
ncbi:hypothetical protein ACVRXF_04755 [Streptococcus orisasini]|uniref:hypothetical protein n=1 Tax=Streptococcus orisasini TaxID=1080071 RepID=UPI000A67E52B|nr:hypothetical protein [Streptococcus orisasini]